MIVHDAATTFVALYDAAVNWLILLATVGSILVIAAVACGAWGIPAVRGALSARETAEQPTEAAPEPQAAHNAPQPPPRPVPSWARTDHHNTEEAA